MRWNVEREERKRDRDIKRSKQNERGSGREIEKRCQGENK